MFNPKFYNFLQILTDGGEYYYFSEMKLKVIDEIDAFFEGFENKRSLPKPLFIKIVFQLLCNQIDSFNTLSKTDKVSLLSQIDSNIRHAIKNIADNKFD